jgi:hypothetical protein
LRERAMTRKLPGWAQWEEDIQELFGLDGTICSGNKFHDPGDAVSRDNPHDGTFRLFVDCKYTEKLSYSFRRADWEKWTERAAERGMRPAMAVRIWPRGLIGPADAMIVSVDDLAELITKAEKLDEIEKAYRGMPRRLDEKMAKAWDAGRDAL